MPLWLTLGKPAASCEKAGVVLVLKEDREEWQGKYCLDWHDPRQKPGKLQTQLHVVFQKQGPLQKGEETS